MRYLIFQTEQEAEEAQAEIWEQVKPSAEYRNGQPVEPITVRWATPQQLTDGRWAIPSHNDKGEEINDFNGSDADRDFLATNQMSNYAIS